MPVGVHRAPRPHSELLSRRPAWLRSPAWLRGADRVTTIVCAFAITVFTWAGSLVAPGPWVDPQWQVSLAVAVHRGIQFGPSIDFTYGPLGAVANQVLYYRSTALMALMFVFASTFLLALLILHSMRSWLWFPLAVAVTWCVVAISTAYVDGGDLYLGVGIAVGLFCARETRPSWRLVELGVLAALAASQILVKFSGGLLLLGFVVVLVVLSKDRRRETIVGASAYVGVLLLLWLGTGQSLTNLPRYLVTSVHIASGYSGAMSLPGGNGDLSPVQGLLIALLVVTLLLMTLRTRSTRERIAVSLLVIPWLWVVFEEGYVRNDFPHYYYFLGLILILIPLLPVAGAGRPTAMATLAAICLVCFLAAQPGRLPSTLTSPLERSQALTSEVLDITSASRAARLESGYREAFHGLLPRRVLSLLGDKTFAVEPIMNIIPWEYPYLRWDPEPLMQAYSGYTSSLDHMDAAFLASPAAPDALLEQPYLAIDSRYSFFEPPLTQVTTLCRYEQAAYVGGWQLLLKGANRCEAEQALGSAVASYGRDIYVPQPGPSAMTVAVFHLGQSLLDRAREILYKSPRVWINLISGGRRLTYRFIPGTAADPHVMIPPSDLGWAHRASPLSVGAFSVTADGQPSGHGSVRVDFYRIPFSGAS